MTSSWRAQLIREGDEILDELARMESAVSHHEALVEMLAGRPEEAEARLRPGYEKLERMGEHELLATTAALLAQAVYAQGRPEEADELCRVSERIAAPEDIVTQVMWRGMRARIRRTPRRCGDRRGARPRGGAARGADGPGSCCARTRCSTWRRSRGRRASRRRRKPPLAERSSCTSARATSSPPRAPDPGCLGHGTPHPKLSVRTLTAACSAATDRETVRTDKEVDHGEVAVRL